MTPIHRYSNIVEVTTPLDPLSDVLSWIRGYRSSEYMAEILQQKHGFRAAQSTQQAARAIAKHAETAGMFLDQAFSGRTELSFLPIYYALANLAKITIITSGRIHDLARQRLHGATWSGISTASHDLATDHISLQGEGVIPLLYTTLTGTPWPTVRRRNRAGQWIASAKRRIQMRDVYPLIPSISHEFHDIYAVPQRVNLIDVYTDEVAPNSYCLVVKFQESPLPAGRRRSDYKILRGLAPDAKRFVSQPVAAASSDDAISVLMRDFPAYLLYSDIVTARLPPVGGPLRGKALVTFTPASSSSLLWPEELPILLAFFHLSNVVRYDPEWLHKLFDSKAAGLLEVLVRHATYRYLLLFCSALNKTTFFIT